jgi:hypothetical protein
MIEFRLNWYPAIKFLLFCVQYRTPYLEGLVTRILGFSGFWIFMQRNFNTDKIKNKNYMLRYDLSTKLYRIKILLFSDAYQYNIFLHSQGTS